MFVDTSVWSLAFRRDTPPDLPEIRELRRSVDAGTVYCTGLVLQELLQGFSKPKAHKQIIEHFSALPLLIPDRVDHVHAAEIGTAAVEKAYRQEPLMRYLNNYVFVMI